MPLLRRTESVATRAFMTAQQPARNSGRASYWLLRLAADATPATAHLSSLAASSSSLSSGGVAGSAAAAVVAPPRCCRPLTMFSSGSGTLSFCLPLPGRPAAPLLLQRIRHVPRLLPRRRLDRSPRQKLHNRRRRPPVRHRHQPGNWAGLRQQPGALPGPGPTDPRVASCYYATQPGGASPPHSADLTRHAPPSSPVRGLRPQETGRVTEHIPQAAPAAAGGGSGGDSSALLRVLAAFGNASAPDDAGVRGIAVRAEQTTQLLAGSTPPVKPPCLSC